MDKAEQRAEKLAERLEAVEKIQASQEPVIAMGRNIGGKLIWTAIAYAFASSSALAVLGYLLKSQSPGA
jgi:dienelactone hydrolase